MKIFVSSVMTGFEDYREAAFAAIRSLDHDIIRAEDFPASTSPSRVACLQGVREADLVILILGERYGWSGTQSGLSPTHEEFREAVAEGKVIPFVQAGVTRDEDQDRFVAEVENYDTGRHRGKTFHTPDELRSEVTRAIARHQLSEATTPVDVVALVDKARATIPVEERGYIRMQGPLLHLAVVGGPAQTIVRPSEIDDPAFIDSIVTELSGSEGYFSYRLRTQPRLENGALVIEQENGAALRIDEAGSLLLSVPIQEADGHMRPLIEEHVSAAIMKALTFADHMLERLDRTQRLTRVVIVADIRANNMFGWRTVREHAASPDQMQVFMNQRDADPVMLTPPDKTRGALKAEQRRLTEDLLALLRRKHRT